MQRPVYTPEQLQMQRLGARLVLGKMLDDMNGDWNQAGVELWTKHTLRSLEQQDGL